MVEPQDPTSGYVPPTDPYQPPPPPPPIGPPPPIAPPSQGGPVYPYPPGAPLPPYGYGPEYGYGSGYLPVPPGPRKWNGFAIASLVFGIIGGIILAVPFGIVALVGGRRQTRRGAGMAIAGLTLSALWVVGIAVAVTYDNGHKVQRSADGTVKHAGSVAPTDLQIGDCVELPTQIDAVIVTVAVRPCSDLHNGQVFTIVQSTVMTYPGQAENTQRALTDCEHEAVTYLGSQAPTSDLHIVAFTARESRWNAGDRAERCLLVDRSKDFTGDIRSDH